MQTVCATYGCAVKTSIVLIVVHSCLSDALASNSDRVRGADGVGLGFTMGDLPSPPGAGKCSLAGQPSYFDVGALLDPAGACLSASAMHQHHFQPAAAAPADFGPLHKHRDISTAVRTSPFTRPEPAEPLKPPERVQRAKHA